MARIGYTGGRRSKRGEGCMSDTRVLYFMGRFPPFLCGVKIR